MSTYSIAAPCIGLLHSVVWDELTRNAEDLWVAVLPPHGQPMDQVETGMEVVDVARVNADVLQKVQHFLREDRERNAAVVHVRQDEGNLEIRE